MDINGLLLVNKPVGPTSFDVIRVLRRQVGTDPSTGSGFRDRKRSLKIGHAGTLDPLASGLMLMLFGTGTKVAMSLTKLDKRYLAQIRLGANSTTGDNEGEKLPMSDRVPTLAEVETALKRLTGEITQTPSPYSAIKINGKEAYKRARAGETVEMPSRQVTVYENILIRYDYPIIELDSKVSSGTYIRTLAEDIGKILGTGGYLTGLVRTEVGEYRLEDAVELAEADAVLVSSKILTISAK